MYNIMLEIKVGNWTFPDQTIDCPGKLGFGRTKCLNILSHNNAEVYVTVQTNLSGQNPFVQTLCPSIFCLVQTLTTSMCSVKGIVSMVYLYCHIEDVVGNLLTVVG